MCSRYKLLFILLVLSCILIYFLQFRFSFAIILSPWNYRSILNSTRKETSQSDYVAIILAREASTKVMQQLIELIDVGIDAFVMCDKRPVNGTDRLLYVDDTTLQRYGLQRNRAWDRVFVWLYNQSSIRYVWIMEDDTAWADALDVKNFFDKYKSNSADLLSRNIIYRNNATR